MAETPIRTKTIIPLSRSERGRNAESSPIVKPRKSQSRTPPTRSETVTGSASTMIVPHRERLPKGLAEVGVESHVLEEERVLPREATPRQVELRLEVRRDEPLAA